MPRSKQNIRSKDFYKEKVAKAIKALKEKKLNLTDASKLFKIPITSLRRYYLNAMESGESDTDKRENFGFKRVFSLEQERILMDYIKEAAMLNFGLTLTDVRKFAYQFAKNHLIKYPTVWDTNKIAGEHWLQLFNKRFSNEVSLLKRNSTSMVRFFEFNKHMVEITFNNYTKALAQCSPDLQAVDIWNIDELELFIDPAPPNMLAPTDVGSVRCGEIGNTLMMIAACNAGGGFVPPVLIFPSILFSDSMINDASEGVIVADSSPGWSNETIFLEYMNHFIKFAKPAKEHRIIVLMDCDESHISIPILRLAKDSGIILVTLHPQARNEMQPLGKTVFGPFETYFHLAHLKLMTPRRKRKQLTINEIAGLVEKAFSRAFTPTNILNGFKATGLHPLDKDIFIDSGCDIGD